MLSKKPGFVAAAVAALLCFFSVTYFSCSKDSASADRCYGNTCVNGFCHIDTLTFKPTCVCPVGYEGATCATPSLDKYENTWSAKQTILGSDSTENNGKVTDYLLYLKKSATPTVFMINNFMNRNDYNGIMCRLDSVNSYTFVIDTVATFHMIIDRTKIMWGSGYISPAHDSIYATYCLRRLSATTNWTYDTVKLILRPYTP